MTHFLSCQPLPINPFPLSPRTEMPRVVPAAHRRGHSQLSDARTLHDRDLSSSGRRHHGRLHCRGGEPTLSSTIRTHAALTSHGQRLEWKRWWGREWRWHGGWGRHMTMMVHVICVQSTLMTRGLTKRNVNVNVPRPFVVFSCFCFGFGWCGCGGVARWLLDHFWHCS